MTPKETKKRITQEPKAEKLKPNQFRTKTEAVRVWKKDPTKWSHIELPGDGFAYLVPVFKKATKKDGG